MIENENQILDSNLTGQNALKLRRRDLLPWWIKVFLWLFLVMGSITPVIIVLGLFGLSTSLGVYGINANNPVSVIGMGIICILILKGIVALGLWTEKDWAVRLGQLDAVIGILICTFSMTVYPFIDGDPEFNLTFRLELVALIPYFHKLTKIEKDWKRIGGSLS